MKNRQKAKAAKYSEVEVTKWLSWLAKNMQQHGKSVFLIEELQISWLSYRLEKIMHQLLSIVLLGLIGALIGGISGVLIFGLSDWESGGAVFGLTDWLIRKQYPRWIVGLIGGVIYGLIVGLGGGLIFSTGRKENYISTLEATTWSWNNLTENWKDGFKKSAQKGLIIGLIGGLIIGLILLVNKELNDWTKFSEWLSKLTTVVLISGVIGALSGAIASGWEKDIPETSTTPNEGIRLTYRSSKKGFIFGLVAGSVLGFFVGLAFSLMEEKPFVGLMYGLVVGLGSGLFSGVWLGGMAVIRHYLLCYLIYLRGYGPWDYVDFLDFAVDELQFMQRVGGGYIFIHRMLLDHFAETEEKKTPTIKDWGRSLVLT